MDRAQQIYRKLLREGYIISSFRFLYRPQLKNEFSWTARTTQKSIEDAIENEKILSLAGTILGVPVIRGYTCNDLRITLDEWNGCGDKCFVNFETYEVMQGYELLMKALENHKIKVELRPSLRRPSLGQIRQKPQTS